MLVAGQAAKAPVVHRRLEDGDLHVLRPNAQHPFEALKEQAKALLNLTLLARQRDYKDKPASFWQKLIDRVRKPIEGVISVLTECFGIEHILVRSDIGLYRRTQAKATAFSLGRYFNEVLGIEKKMNIARYAV